MESAHIPTDGQAIRLVSLSEAMRLTGRGKSNIYAGVRAGTFPKPIKDGSSSRWVLREIEQFIRDRIAERDSQAAA
jgi:prophage regulatory protein